MGIESRVMLRVLMERPDCIACLILKETLKVKPSNDETFPAYILLTKFSLLLVLPSNGMLAITIISKQQEYARHTESFG